MFRQFPSTNTVHRTERYLPKLLFLVNKCQSRPRLYQRAFSSKTPCLFPVETSINNVSSNKTLLTTFKNALLRQDVNTAWIVFNQLVKMNEERAITFNQYSDLLHLINKSGFDLAKGSKIIEYMEKIGVQYNSQLGYTPIASFYANHGKSSQVETILSDMLARKVQVNQVFFNHLIAAAGKVSINSALHYLQKMTEMEIPPNVVSYNTILSCCKSHRNTEILEEVLRSMKERSIDFDKYTYKALLDIYAMNRDTAKVLDLYHALEKNEHLLFHPQIRPKLIDVLSKAGQTKSLQSMYQLMLEHEVRVDAGLYNALISAYSSSSQTDKAVKVMQDMLKKGLQPPARACNMVIQSYVSKKAIGKASSFFQQLKQAKVKPDATGYTAMINGYIQAGDFSNAELLVAELTSDNKPPNVLTYGALIDGYTKRGKLSNALDLLQSMKDSSVTPNTFIYTSLINAYMKQSKVDEAMDLLRDMLAMGVRPNTVTYNVLINGVLRISKPQKAFEIYKQMGAANVAPNCSTFTVLLQGLARGKRLALIQDLHHDMIHGNTKLDKMAYDSLLSAYSFIGRKANKSLLQAYGDMQSAGFTPNALNCSVLIKCFVEELEVDKAFDVYQSMVKSGYAPTSSDCNALIQSCGHNNGLDKALEVYSAMIKQEHSPTPYTYAVLISMCAKHRRLSKAMEFYQSMLDRDINPTTFVYNSLVKVCASHNNSEEIAKLLQSMKQRNVYPDVATYTLLIDHYAKNSNMPKALEIYDQMCQTDIEPNTITRTVLANGFLKNNQAEKATEILETMVSTGARPDLYTYSSLINAYCKSSRLAEALLKYQDMLDDGYQPNAVLLNTLMDSFGKNHDLEHTLAIYRDMKSWDIAPTVQTYNILMNAHLINNDPAKALEWHDAMVKSNVQPNQFTIAILMNCHNYQGQLQEVFNLWNAEKSNLFHPDSQPSGAISVLLDACGHNDDITRLRSTWAMLKKEGYRLTSNNLAAYVEALCRLGCHDEAYEQFESQIQELNITPDIKLCRTITAAFIQDQRTGQVRRIRDYLTAEYPHLLQELTRDEWFQKQPF
ncbi:TPR-like protein [Basidiobolus meristosporus CBS 931.73]|uniref:TPR-like protein n=1 Tax=Basidiobolus meristosporus CBS 931.73 TaxID=1314790 RepID=A0A1Y1Y7Q6_9FUNG|nr:TPR-like protein [Basidiobolus meristosporus CBS 931.73]|eukprot:ORX94052.1 TPR-like protein [Basidiobolus meristosporus CBS 931.73]